MFEQRFNTAASALRTARTVVELTRVNAKRPPRPGEPNSVGSISQKAVEMVNVDGEFAGTSGAVRARKEAQRTKREQLKKKKWACPDRNSVHWQARNA
jgi:hypothetical protein